MTRLFRVAVFSTLLLAGVCAFAQNNGPAANGDFQFSIGGSSNTLTFDAREQNRGTTRGQIQFTSSEGPSNPGDSIAAQSSGFTLTTEVDCLRIVGNRAIMAGKITASSEPSYVGVRTLLVVEDGGEGSKQGPDKFTWGVYRGSAVTWLATDAELEFDSGAGLTWWATDAEREDDVGRPSHASNDAVNCESFSLSSYDLLALPLGAGNIQVKP